MAGLAEPSPRRCTVVPALFFLLLITFPSFMPIVNSFTLENSKFQYRGRTFRTWGSVNAVDIAPPGAQIWVYSRANSSWLPVAELNSIVQNQGFPSGMKDGNGKSVAEAAVSVPAQLRSHANVPGQSFGSLARFSDASLWVTGPSGSIYERFWNAAQWVFIPHDLPVGSGRATALAAVNRTVLATSEKGQVYHMYQNSKQQLVWRFCGPSEATGPKEGTGSKEASARREGTGRREGGGTREGNGESVESGLRDGNASKEASSLEEGTNGQKEGNGPNEGNGRTAGSNGQKEGNGRKHGLEPKPPGHMVKGPGIPTGEGGTVFFVTNDGRLAELVNLWPAPLWNYHGAPRDADVAAVADAGLMRPNFVLIISSAGDLYELELRPTQTWRKHSRAGSDLEGVRLLPGNGVVMRGAHGVSIFLPTADGRLAERRRSRNAWIWLLHNGPPCVNLSVEGRGPLVVPYQALMAQGGAPPIASLHVAGGSKAEPVLFATGEDGSVWEYEPKFSLPKVRNSKTRASNWRTAKKDVASPPGGDSDQGTWTPHRDSGYPVKAGVTGIELSRKRLIFMLEDGRLIERFLSGAQVNEGWPSDAFWIVVEVPESEGGNAEYCTTDQGPLNCLDGVKGRLVKTPPQQQQSAGAVKQTDEKRTDMLTESDEIINEVGCGCGLADDKSGSASTPPKLEADEDDVYEDDEYEGDEETDVGESGKAAQPTCVELKQDRCTIGPPSCSSLSIPSNSGAPGSGRSRARNALSTLRGDPATGTMFLLGPDGRVAENRWKGGGWTWRTEDNPRATTVALAAAINGSLFTIDDNGSVWLRERVPAGWNWHDIRPPGGVKVHSGFPVDWGTPEDNQQEQLEGPLYFISVAGSLLEFELDEGGAKWHDVGTPKAGVVVAGIADYGNIRARSVFCIGSDSRLYQFNTVVRKWSFPGQPWYLKISPEPGAVLRLPGTTRGSLFLRSENRGFIDFAWVGSVWVWNEHGHLPGRTVTVAAPVGPAVALAGGNVSVLVVGSNGEVYERRKIDEPQVWKWVKHGYPNTATLPTESGWLAAFQRTESNPSKPTVGYNQPPSPGDSVCNPKVAPLRPLHVSATSAIFTLQDGRLAEMRFDRDAWAWVSVISTPFTTCFRAD